MVKIDFCDMPISFIKENNFITDILNKRKIEYVVSKNPDFLFYSCYGNNHYSYHNSVKIFWTVEPVSPNFNECDYAVAFDYLSYEGRYLRRPIWMFEEIPKVNQISDEQALNRKFCNFVYSNDKNGFGAKLRKQFANELMKYKKVDCPGKVLNNMADSITPREGNWREGKLDFIKDYKFTIAFENTNYNGYVTEKMTEPLSVKSIPIYWGDPLVDRNFNKKSFVYCNGYEGQLDVIVKEIIRLDTDDGAYLSMLHENPMNEGFNYLEKENLSDFITQIIEKGANPFNKDPLQYNLIGKQIVTKKCFPFMNLFTK